MDMFPSRPVDVQIMEFNMTDDMCKGQWEELLGFKLHSDKVRITRELYEANAVIIQGIQMGAAFRLKARDGNY